MSTISENRAVGRELTGQAAQEKRYLHLYQAYRKNQISEAQFKADTRLLQIQTSNGGIVTNAALAILTKR